MDNKIKLISIKKASEILGVTPQTLRVWEKNGLIEVSYTISGHRRYVEDYVYNLATNKSLNCGKNKE